MSSDLLRLLTLQDANTRVVLAGTGLLGLACGVVGALAVLRRRSLVGDAVAHAALPGVCVAYLVIGDRDLAWFLLGALVLGVLAASAISLIRAHTRIKEDAAIGIVLGSFFGLGIALSRIIQNTPGGNKAGLDGFIFGKAASMVRGDVVIISCVAAGALAAVAAMFKELRLLCFDREFAGALGWPVLMLDLALMGLVCACTVAGLPAVGAVMVAALLIIPGAAARFWTDRFGIMLLVAGTIGALAGVIGTSISAVVDLGGHGLPTGPAIVLVAAAAFTVSMVAAPRRGILVDRWRRRSVLGVPGMAAGTGGAP